MKISKAKLRQIIREEIGRAIEPKDGWTTTKDPGGRKRPLGKPVPVGDPEEERDYDEEDLLAMQHGVHLDLEENITPGVQQLMKHYPHAAAKIKELAGNGYRASEIKRMLQLR